MKMYKAELRVLVMIANGHHNLFPADHTICLSLQKKGMLTRSPNVKGWVITQPAITYLQASKDVLVVKSVTYYVIKD
jgi:hypothetical protein